MINKNIDPLTGGALDEREVCQDISLTPEQAAEVKIAKETGEFSKKDNVGDLTSDQIGSGARFNSGKPDYSLMLLSDYPYIENVDNLLSGAFHELGEFQLSGNKVHLVEAIQHVYDYVVEYNKENGVSGFVFEPVVRLWEFGESVKYTRWNWVKGMKWSIPIGCAARHYLEIAENGQTIDDESGQPHWAAFVCNLQMLLHYVEVFPEGNDLPYLVHEQEKEVVLDDRFENTPITTFNFELEGPKFKNQL